MFLFYWLTERRRPGAELRLHGRRGNRVVGVLGWAFQRVQLPTINLTSPWAAGVLFTAIPLSFLVAIAAARLIPAKGTSKGIRSFAL